jgi:uncharacterized protein (DUF2147 family)
MARPFCCLLLTFCLAGSLTPLPATAAGDDSAVVGVWEVEDKSGRIEIHRCGPRFCGRIAWLREPTYPADDPGGMGGKPLVDRDNPKKELRNRPQLGLQIMEGYAWKGNNLWDEGTIYNTENGTSYRSSLTLLDRNRLKLRAYVGISLFGGSTVWQRVPATR